MNKVILMGRLVRDAEIRYTQEHVCVAKFTLAVDRIKKGEADFINCTAFGKAGEFVEKYIKKGTKIALEGRWQTGSYTNKEGTKVYTNDCIVEHLEFAESKKTDGNCENVPSPQDSTDDFMNVPTDLDDEIPFV